jgi:hypothetical protein
MIDLSSADEEWAMEHARKHHVQVTASKMNDFVDRVAMLMSSIDAEEADARIDAFNEIFFNL